MAMACGTGDLAGRQRKAEQQTVRPRHDAAQLLFAQPLAVDRFDPCERHARGIELPAHDVVAFGRSLKADEEDRDQAHRRHLVPMRFRLVNMIATIF